MEGIQAGLDKGLREGLLVLTVLVLTQAGEVCLAREGCSLSALS